MAKEREDFGYDPRFDQVSLFDKLLADVDYEDTFDFEPIFDQDGAGFEEICNLTDMKIHKKITGQELSAPNSEYSI